MHCLIGFSDAIQVIGDAGKWSSRDIGTSLTRFCLRQRALENEMKAFTTALMENFAAPLEKKGIEWKQRLSEIERRHQKNLKKTRSKKQSLAGDLVSEHRAGCSEILMEQRTQFSTFAGLLLPVIVSIRHAPNSDLFHHFRMLKFACSKKVVISKMSKKQLNKALIRKIIKALSTQLLKMSVTVTIHHGANDSPLRHVPINWVVDQEQAAMTQVHLRPLQVWL